MSNFGERGGEMMAWCTEQIFADFLNRFEEHTTVKDTLISILDDNVELTLGTLKFEGINEVIKYLEEASIAIHSESGFKAKPVIIIDTNDTQFGLNEGNSYKAVALHSKLEDYISWFFMLKCNESWRIERIIASRGEGYSYYFDLYEEGNYDYVKPN